MLRESDIKMFLVAALGLLLCAGAVVLVNVLVRAESPAMSEPAAHQPGGSGL